MSNISYKFMTFVYRIRDKFLQHSEILREAGLKPGFHVIDYGCGPGGYIAAASDIVGETGKIYAIDINPLAIESARNIVINKVTIQPSLRPYADGENPLISVYDNTFFSF